MADSFWAKLSRSLGAGKAGATPREKEVAKCLADLKDANADRRRSAAWTLGKIRPVPKNAVEALTTLAEKDPDLGVRHSAQWALKAIRGG